MFLAAVYKQSLKFQTYLILYRIIISIQQLPPQLTMLSTKLIALVFAAVATAQEIHTFSDRHCKHHVMAYGCDATQEYVRSTAGIFPPQSH